MSSFQSLGTRTTIILCFWSTILLSIPFWIKTTTITRLPLPTQQVERWEQRHTCPVHFRTSLSLQLDPQLRPDAQLDDAVEKETKELLLDSLQAKGRRGGSQSLACTDWSIDVHTTNASSSSHSADYSLYITSELSSRQGYADDVLIAPDHKDGALPDAISAAVIQRLLSLLGEESLASPTRDADAFEHMEQDSRVIQYSRHVRLIFSLMNQDATKGGAHDSSILSGLRHGNTSNPVIKLVNELRDLHDFHIESQVQWFAPLHFTPTREVKEEIEEEVEDDESPQEELDESDEAQVESLLSTPARKKIIKRLEKVLRPRTLTHVEHLIEWDDLKVFVNSAEWSLTSTVPPHNVTGQTHDLHFILYVPSSDSKPLLIRDPETGVASESTAWLIPQWGGVVILNDPKREDAMRLFSDQLATLVGYETGNRKALLSRRILETSRETVETLTAIVRLVDKIENLGVGEEIVSDVQKAIETLHALDQHLANRGTLEAALELSFQAQTLASKAFFSPDMLGLLYFPDEHKYAVYTPLFGPLLVPLGVAAIRCVKEWKARRKQPTRKARKSR